MSGLSLFIIFILGTCGPEPAFVVPDYETCIGLMDKALTDAKCEEVPS